MFYQLSDGRPAIVHPLTMRCLLQHYGAYHLLPHTLEARVVEVEAEQQSESWRKRYRFLAHIPLTASFQLVELDVAPLLPEAAVAPFRAELQQRERRRQVQKQKVSGRMEGWKDGRMEGWNGKPVRAVMHPFSLPLRRTWKRSREQKRRPQDSVPVPLSPVLRTSRPSWRLWRRRTRCLLCFHKTLRLQVACQTPPCYPSPGLPRWAMRQV